MTEPGGSGARSVSWKKIAWRLGMGFVLLLVALEIYNRIPADFVWSRPATLPLLASIILLVGDNVLHAFLWRRMSVDLGSPRPNVRATLHIYFVSSLSRYLVKLGQVAGLAVLANRFGMAAGRVTAAALTAELIKLATGSLLVGFTMHALMRQAYPNLIDPAWIGIVLVILMVASVWIMVASPFGLRTRAALVGRAKGRTAERLTNAFSVLDQARPRDAVIWTVGYTAAWVVVGAAFILFVAAFTPIEPSQWIGVGGIAIFSYLVGYFSFLPAGLGFREASMFFLLKLIGVPESAALTIMVASRFWYTAGEMLPLLLIPISGRKPIVGPAPTAGAVL